MVFGRKSSRVKLVELGKDSEPVPAPPSPQYPDVWDPELAKQVTYFVRSPWQWIMQQIAVEGMTEVVNPSDLPSEKEPKLASAVTPATRRRRNASKKFKGPATLKLEIVNPATGLVDFAVHGTSAALDGLEDKDELVRTLQRCRCDNLNISPPSVLISWDVTHEECLNVVGKALPALEQNKNPKKYAVLKEPMGSQGKGIYFVEEAEEIHKVIDEHRQRALTEPDFLDNLIEVKGRIPSWGKSIWSFVCVRLNSFDFNVINAAFLQLTHCFSFLSCCLVLQAEVAPPLLVKDRRKFHIRTYLVVIEKPQSPDLLDTYVFNRHEIRIAGVPLSEDESERDPMAHITNGALSSTTERVLMDSLDELTKRNLQAKTEIFVAETFGKHLQPDLARRITLSRNEEPNSPALKFAIAGLDIMVTEDNQIFLLEVNVNPATSPESTVDEPFKEHLKGFMHCLVDLVVGKPVPEFLSLRKILEREGLLAD